MLNYLITNNPITSHSSLKAVETCDIDVVYLPTQVKAETLGYEKGLRAANEGYKIRE